MESMTDHVVSREAIALFTECETLFALTSFRFPQLRAVLFDAFSLWLGIGQCPMKRSRRICYFLLGFLFVSFSSSWVSLFFDGSPFSWKIPLMVNCIDEFCFKSLKCYFSQKMFFELIYIFFWKKWILQMEDIYSIFEQAEVFRRTFLYFLLCLQKVDLVYVTGKGW